MEDDAPKTQDKICIKRHVSTGGEYSSKSAEESEPKHNKYSNSSAVDTHPNNKNSTDDESLK